MHDNLNNIILKYCCLVLGPTSIERLYRFGTQQAKSIVKNVFSGEPWCNNPIKELGDLRIPKGVPQGWEKHLMLQKLNCQRHLEIKMTSAIRDSTLLIRNI